MMRYLHHVDLSLPFKERMAQIEDDVEMIYDKSRTFRDIHILVRFSNVSEIYLVLMEYMEEGGNISFIKMRLKVLNPLSMCKVSVTQFCFSEGSWV